MGRGVREIGGGGGSLVCSVTGRSTAPSPALAASEHNTAVVGVMMEVSPVSELPRVLTQEKHSHFERLNFEEFSSQSVNIVILEKKSLSKIIEKQTIHNTSATIFFHFDSGKLCGCLPSFYFIEINTVDC